MSDDKKRVLVDTDFVNHVLSSCDNETEGQKLISSLFNELGFIPCVHPWVADYEFVSDKLKKMITNGMIETISWNELLGNNEENRDIYQFIVCDFYEKLTNEKLDLKGFPITKFRKSNSSLGEVQSVVAAQQLNIPIMCSNDHGAKDLSTLVNSSSFELKVYNVSEIAVKISENPNTDIKIEQCKKMVFNSIPNNRNKRKKFISIIKSNYKTHIKN